MPVKLGRKKYKTFAKARSAVMRKKGLSKKRASAYVAAVERKMGINPRTGGKLRKSKRRKKR